MTAYKIQSDNLLGHARLMNGNLVMTRNPDLPIALFKFKEQATLLTETDSRFYEANVVEIEVEQDMMIMNLYREI